MSSIVIAGDTSGTVTLQAPAVAGSTTVNLPSTPGNNGASAVVTTNASGNLGLGVTPGAWTTYRVMDVGGNQSITSYQDGATNTIGFAANALWNGSWVYRQSSVGASRYALVNNTHQWSIAPSGTAGNTISFTQAMTLDANGYLGFNGFPAITRNVGGARSQNLVLISTAAGVSGEPTELANICAGSSTATMRIFAGVNVPGGMLELNGGGAPADAGTMIFRSGTGGSASTPPERARITSGGALLVGTTSASGSASNTANVVGGVFSSLSGTTSISSGTPVTLFTVPQGSAFFVTIKNSNTAADDGISTYIVQRDNSAVWLTAIKVNAGGSGRQFSLQVSGTNLQGVNNIGGADAAWSAMRIS